MIRDNQTPIPPAPKLTVDPWSKATFMSETKTTRRTARRTAATSASDPRSFTVSAFAGLAVALLMGGCSAESRDTSTSTSTLWEMPSTTTSGSTDPAARYEVDVDGGFGSGSYPPGTTVHVWSAVSTTNGVAQRWSGDVGLLAEPDEWRTTFVMPARDVLLVATSNTQELALDTETFNGLTTVAKTVRYHFPPQMRGVVLFSHGTGGSGAFIESTEAFPLALALMADGYGVMSIDAEEAAAGDLNGDGKQRWVGRASTDNVDLGNLQVLFDSFEQRGLISTEIPKFALGMSAGGNFSHLLGTIAATPAAASFQQLRFAAVVSYCADATASRSSSLSTTPSAWYMCAADDNPEVSNAEARANKAELRQRGVATDYAEHSPSPLYDERFTRIDGIDAATSAAMAAELRAAGFTDDAGFITSVSDEITSAVSADPASFPTIMANPRVNQVRLQIKVMRAEHAMFADLTRRTIDFLDRFNPMPST